MTQDSFSQGDNRSNSSGYSDGSSGGGSGGARVDHAAEKRRRDDELFCFVFEFYTSGMRARGLVAFTDMVVLALQLLTQCVEVRR